jgi:two-component system, chemotaxis family, sensor kinase CheA
MNKPSNLIARIIRTVILPPQISQFERTYLERMNRIGMWFFALHVPAIACVAAFNETIPLLAIVLTALVALGPVAARLGFSNPRAISNVYGLTAMFMGGLLVHFGQGPMQIEMHFYFFALIAMLALFGNPSVILVAAATVALHHLAVWFLVPASVFNYDAAVWVVLVHAAFVVLESVAAVMIARSFFDNVIGLEKIVTARTSELDARNREMRLVLDTVDQALVMVGRDGVMGAERSAILDVWFGTSREHSRFVDFLRTVDPLVADSFEFGFDQLLDGYMPIEVTLAQLPSRISKSGRTYGISYTPIFQGADLARLLVVVSDVTSELERARLEAEQSEVVRVFDRIVADRAGFIEFCEETEDLISSITDPASGCDLRTLKRALHTLKGNSMIFGVQTVAEVCHAIESSLEEEQRPPSPAERAQLAGTWTRLKSKLRSVLDQDAARRIEIEPTEFHELLAAAVRDAPRLAQLIADLKLEPTARRLNRVAEQARRISDRLGKGEIKVELDDQTLRIDPVRWQRFWSVFVHVVRNAVDHGLEFPDERAQVGKAPGMLKLKTAIDRHEFVISVSDDGRGIAWDIVRERALAQGIPAATHEDLEVALFHDGLSTKSEITEYSGRGVGLAVVREACAAHGGRVRVISAPGTGSTFEFRFPIEAMAPTPEQQLSTDDSATRAA